MRKAIISIWVIICCMCMGCKQQVSEHSGYPVSYTINYEADEKFDWYSHMVIEEVIPFEFSDSSMISLVRDCQVTDNKILIQDFKQHVLFVFDRHGKLLYSICNKGNGPGEYQRINNFCLSYTGKEIIINDGYKLLYYDLVSGRYLYSIPLKLKVDNPVRNVAFSYCLNPSDGIYYLWTDMGDYTLYKYDGKEMVGLIPRTNYQLCIKKFVVNYKGDYLFCPDYGDFGISTIDGDKRFYIDFDKNALPEEKIPDNIAEFQKIDKEPYFKAIVNVQETESGIYVSAISPKNNYYDIYIDKATGQIWKGGMDTKSRLNIVQVEGNSFYAFFYPDYVDDDSLLKQELTSFISLGENPLLIKFKMKE